MNSEAYWSYHSGMPAVQRDYLRHARTLRFLPLSVPEDTGNTFQIKLRTTQYAPNHIVTLRNSVDGWARDVFGMYRDREWIFTLEKGIYPAGMRLKFLLDRERWMQGGDLLLPAPNDQTWTEAEVVFTGQDARFPHGYDNLHVSEDASQQAVVHSNYDETVAYDVVIVGSGMGGGTLADALTDRGVKTLVLDAGSLEFPTHIVNVPGEWSKLPGRHGLGHFTNEDGSKFIGGVQMNLGGRSVFWSGIIPRMQGWELASWPQPIRDYLTQQDGGYDRAEKQMRKQVTLGPYQDGVMKRLTQKFGQDWDVVITPRSRDQPEVNVPSIIKSSTGVYSTAELLLDSLTTKGRVGRDHLNVNLNHLVTELQRQDGKVSAVICQDLVGNRTRTYQGKYIVLAAGSVESPKVALQSKLPNAKIGVGLTDHPAYFSNVYTIPAGSEFAGVDKHAKIYFYPRANGRQFNVEVTINGEYWDVRHADDEVWQARLGSKTETRVQFKFLLASALDDENYIRLNASGSGKLRVKVKPNLSGSSPADWAAVRDLRNELCNFFGIAGVPVEDFMHFGNEGTVHHAGGSLRMSGDGSGVVDTDLRFEGIENLVCMRRVRFPAHPGGESVPHAGRLEPAARRSPRAEARTVNHSPQAQHSYGKAKEKSANRPSLYQGEDQICKEDTHRKRRRESRARNRVRQARPATPCRSVARGQGSEAPASGVGAGRQGGRGGCRSDGHRARGKAGRRGRPRGESLGHAQLGRSLSRRTDDAEGAAALRGKRPRARARGCARHRRRAADGRSAGRRG